MDQDTFETRVGSSSKAEDLYSWARRQAELLRAVRLAEIDPAARDEAAIETGLPLGVFPAARPYEFDEIIERPVVWSVDEASRLGDSSYCAAAPAL